MIHFLNKIKDILKGDKGFYLILAGLAIILFLPAIGFKYSYFDDYYLIVVNQKYLADPGNIFDLFGSDVFRADTVAYRPLLVASFMLDAKIAGISPWIYHLTNLVIHYICAGLLFSLLRKFEVAPILSFFLSAFFLVHPLMVQAVAWIPGRNDTLLGLWMLCFVISLVNYSQTRAWYWVAGSMLFLAVALFTKESAVGFPVAGLIILLAAKGKGSRAAHSVYIVLGWLTITLLWLFIRNSVITANPGSGQMVFNSAWENIQGMPGYAGKVLFPFNLSVLPIPKPAMLWYGLSALAVLLFFVRFWGVKNRLVFYSGLSIAVIFIMPHLLRGTDFAFYHEHRIYVSFIGAIIMLSQMNWPQRIKLDKPLYFALSWIFIAFYAVITIVRLPVYYDQDSLLLNLVDNEPQVALSYTQWGYIFIEQGEYERAGLYYKRALQLDPENKDIYHGLGIVYESLGQWQKAEDSFKKSLELAPRSSSLRYNLAYLYHQRGDTAGAERQYQLAILSRPENIEAQLNLGMLYHQQGKLEKARRQYLRTLDIDGRIPEALFNLGILYRQKGWEDSSRLYLGRALKLKPDLIKLLGKK
ncbi:MAG: tetratricopeptide repeat protein [Candidatus Edwardsbacteria bacterium]|nr:tetratricopeptide repeat protein [Candidatus Edwardsbacteria bacterium]